MGGLQALARVGAIVEEPRFHPHLTGRENLHVHAAARDRERSHRVEGALKRVGLAARADDPVKSLLARMRERLGIARCLLCDPELPILDEPVNGLDPAGILDLRNLVRSLVAEGRTVLLSSHLLDEVEKTCVPSVRVTRGEAIRGRRPDALDRRSHSTSTGRSIGGVELLQRAYEAFNARDIEAALALMHEDVDWPNGMEGGRVAGRDEVRAYWRRQFTLIDSHVEPMGFTEGRRRPRRRRRAPDRP